MKNKIISILTILLILSISLNIYLIFKHSYKNDEKKELIESKYKITSSFMIIHDENDNIKYYNDLSNDLVDILNSNNNKQLIYNKYGFDVSENIQVTSINETNTLYQLTISSNKQEDLVNIGNDILNILRQQEVYNIKIQIIDGFSKEGITKIN